jgi:hypothetical protein
MIQPTWWPVVLRLSPVVAMTANMAAADRIPRPPIRACPCGGRGRVACVACGSVFRYVEPDEPPLPVARRRSPTLAAVAAPEQATADAPDPEPTWLDLVMPPPSAPAVPTVIRPLRVRLGEVRRAAVAEAVAATPSLEAAAAALQISRRTLTYIRGRRATVTANPAP